MTHIFKTCKAQYPKFGIAAVVASVMLFTVSITAACPIRLPTMSVVINGTGLKLEIAATPAARECGLSLRYTLPADHGMLFVVPEPIMLDFWMTNTQLLLSIAFLDDTGRILSIQKMQPGQTQEHYRSPAPARYAIEVHQGWFSEHKVNVGDVIELHLPVMMLVH